jgi:hypothetical protein
MKLLNKIIAAGLTLACAGTALAALTPDEIKQLGTTLTPIGAEKAGNADGSIPAYTGGLTTPPAGFKKGGLRIDPFADEKPLISINAKNMAQYSDKLTEGVKTLMKKYPDYRIDVYKTHRTIAFPKYVTENTLKNAGKATATADGLTIKTPQATYPFPIPKNGVEAMWNHILKYTPTTRERARSFTVDASGRAVLAGEMEVTQDYPYWKETPTSYDYFFRLKMDFLGPARRAGEAMMIHESLNTKEDPRRAWQYLPGQRRVKMAPEIGWDTPDPSTSGATTFDDNFLFNGPMDRFNFKLIGKKEMYVPYNAYKLAMHSKPADRLKPHFVNPDYVRWELHRVWVVEATLKPGKRHIYAKRLFYLDEDSWQAVANDQYDARGQLYRCGFCYVVQLYDVPAPQFEPFGHYDMISGQYNLNAITTELGGTTVIPVGSDRYFAPDSLAGSGVR